MLLSAYKGISYPAEHGSNIQWGLQENFDRSMDKIRDQKPKLDQILLRTTHAWKEHQDVFDNGAESLLRNCLANGNDRTHHHSMIWRPKDLPKQTCRNPGACMWAKEDYLMQNRPIPYGWSGAANGRMSVAILVFDPEKYKKIEEWVYVQPDRTMRRQALLGLLLFDLSEGTTSPVQEYHDNLDIFDPVAILASKTLYNNGFFREKETHFVKSRIRIEKLSADPLYPKSGS